MKNIFSLDSPLMNMLRQLADLIILNLLWLLGCIPIITIGASTTALYQAMMKMRKEGALQIWADFWNFFRSNFKKATILFAVVAVATVLAVMGTWIVLALMSDVSFLLRILMLLPILLVVLTLGYVFPLQAQFENSVINTLKNAWVMSRIHFVVSAIVLMLNLIPAATFILSTDLFLKCVPIWVSLSGSLIAYVNTALLQRVFKKYIPAEEVQE